MRCPFCQSLESKVVDSRDTESGIRRRRECLACRRRFTTYERIESVPLWVTKKDGRREEFSRQKLLAGLHIASKKRDIAPERLDALADDVENRLRGEHLSEVPSQAVGEMVMERLREIDEIAYVRFASVYRSFKDVSDMRAEIEAVLASPPGTRRPAPRRPRTRAEGDEELALDLGEDRGAPG
jgi:transcriptional repressor NrdR